MNAMPRKRTDTDAPAAPGMSPLPPLPALDTVDQVHAALADVDHQRLDAQRVVDAESGAEAHLIAIDADEAEFSRLTMRTRQARRQLARLDRREAEIIARARQIEQDRRQTLWAQFRASWTEKANALHDLAVQSRKIEAELRAIGTAAHRAGFGGVQAPPLPEIHGLFPWHLVMAPARLAGAIPAAAPDIAGLSLGPMVMVEFVKPCGGFSMEAIYRIPEQRARWLAEQGFATVIPDNPFGDRLAPELVENHVIGRKG